MNIVQEADKIEVKLGPRPLTWTITVAITTGLMAYYKPPHYMWGTVLLAALTCVFGWLVARHTFASSCETYRRMYTVSFFGTKMLMLGLSFVGLGLCGGNLWWVYGLLVAFLAHRISTQRCYWNTVAVLAALFLKPREGDIKIANSEEQALKLARASIDKEIGRQ